MFEKFFAQIGDFDTQLLISANAMIPVEYAKILKLTSESIVLWCMIFLVGLWLYGVYKKENSYKIQSLRVFFLIIVVFSVYGIIYFFIPPFRPHPGEYLGNMAIKPLIPHPLDNSFPSGHSIFSTTFFLAVCLYVRNIWIILITLVVGILTVCSRVLGGVHYPGDILGGIVFASVAVFFLRAAALKIGDFLSPFLIKIAEKIKL